MYRKLIESAFLTMSLVLIFTACGGGAGGSSVESSVDGSVNSIVDSIVDSSDENVTTIVSTVTQIRPDYDGTNMTELVPVDLSTEEVSIDTQNIPNLLFEDVSHPITTVLGGGRPLLAPNDDGTWDYITTFFSNYWYHQDFVSIDLGTQQAKLERREGNEAESGYAELWTGYFGAIAPNGKLFIVTRSTPTWLLHVYNPNTDTLETTIALPDYMTGGISMIRTGMDGYIYAASGRKDSGYVTAIRIDPTNNVIQYYGKLGNSDAGQAEYIHVDETHIYIAAGRSPYSLISVPISGTTDGDALNNSDTVLGTTTSGLTEIYSSTYGAAAQVGTTKYWLYNGVLHEYIGLEPWSTGSDGKEYVYDTYPEDKWWPNKPEVDATLMGGNKNNTLWYKNYNQAWVSLSFEGPTYPQLVHRLAPLENGKFIGGGDNYTGLFLHDTATETSTFLGQPGFSHYTTTVYKSPITGKEKAFMSGYPNSSLVLFDTAKPIKTKITAEYDPADPSSITPDSEINPKIIGSFYEAAGCKKMYASALGADGNIYFGGKWRDNGTAGCLGWVNGETLAIDGFYDIFTNYQVRDVTSAGNGRYIVIATVAITDTTGSPLKPTPTKGRIFIYDTTKGKDQVILALDPTDKIETGAIVGVEGNMVVGIVSDIENVSSYYYKFDASTGQMVYRKHLNAAISVSSTDNQFGGNPIRYHNDTIWFNVGGAWADKHLVKVDHTGGMSAVGKIPSSLYAGDFEFNGNHMYSGATTALRKVSNLLIDY